MERVQSYEAKEAVAGGDEAAWRRKAVSPYQALAHIHPGDRVFIGSACGTPSRLVKALIECPVADVELVNLLMLGVAPSVKERLAGRYRFNAFFLSEGLRDAVREARADYTPISLSEIPGLFTSGRMPLDVALVQVSPPDAQGYMSLGVSVDITKSAAVSACRVIAEVNPNMPRTLGDGFLHIDSIDALVEGNASLPVLSSTGESEVARRIAMNAADLIDDGSTIQVGYGGIPDALLLYLRDKKDLGVHTEVVTEGVIDLIEAGVITGKRKTLNAGKVVASLAVGGARLWEAIHDNPLFEFRAVDYTNDPFVIAQNEKMVSINSALEVDLTGQVCADGTSAGFYSGIGGHLDFVRGASRSAGGKAIIVLKSTRDGESASRIVPSLQEGAGVTTPRGDIHYVVTEWGVADLYGKSIRERALALISIAHPAFRETLLQEAKNRRYLPPDQPELSLTATRYPEEFIRCVEIKDGSNVLIRPIRPTDEPAMRKLFHSFSSEYRFYRFFGYLSGPDPGKASKFVNIDYDGEMAFVAEEKRGDRKQFAGAACYSLDRDSGLAEAAIVVRDDEEGRGVGTALGAALIRAAEQRGVKGFVIYVRDTNTRAWRLVSGCGYPVTSKWEDGVYAMTMRLNDES